MARAVVFSGGGPIAVAWECGVASGLAQSGIDLSKVDFILGTSAGAIVGAQIALGCDPIMMAGAIENETFASPGVQNRSNLKEAISRLPELFRKAQSGEHERAEVGNYAFSAQTANSLSTHIASFSNMVGAGHWPISIGIVAVNARSGKAEVLRSDCGATLGTAVAASCSLPGLHPPVPINKDHYIDGGLRSAANVDLVGDFDNVLVLSFHPEGPVGPRIAGRAKAQADMLVAKGASV